MNVEYITQEIIDTIGLMQLNKENIPILENTQIEDIADRFLFEWNENGDFEADFSRMLLEFLRQEFKFNYLNYNFNG